MDMKDSLKKGHPKRKVVSQLPFFRGDLFVSGWVAMKKPQFFYRFAGYMILLYNTIKKMDPHYVPQATVLGIQTQHR